MPEPAEQLPQPFDDRLPKVGGCLFQGFGGLLILAAIPLAFDEPGALALIPFGLVFVGAGWVVRRVFTTPPGKRRVAVEGHEVAIQTSQGLPGRRAQTVAILVDADASEAEVAAARQAWHDEQWAKRPDWAAGRIEEEGRRQAGALACGGLVWTALALGLTVVALVSEEPIMGLVAGGCGLVALGLFVGHLVQRARHKKFAPSLLLLARTPAVLGERLQAVVQTGVREEQGPHDGFRWTLECVHSWEERSGTGDSRRTTHRREVLWRFEERAEGRPSPAAPGFLGFALAVDLPADQPPATLSGSSEGITWELSAHASVPGLDYRVQFLVPVLRPGS